MVPAACSESGFVPVVFMVKSFSDTQLFVQFTKIQVFLQGKHEPFPAYQDAV
jgi:hypothetical protein